MYYGVKTKTLICTFGFAYASCWFPHAKAHFTNILKHDVMTVFQRFKKLLKGFYFFCLEKALENVISI